MKKWIVLVSLVLASCAVMAGSKDKDTKANNPGETIKTNASLPCILSGRVTDLRTGESLTGVKITVAGSDRVTYSDFDGNFTLTDLKPGPCLVVVSLISYQNRELGEIVTAPEQGRLDIKLRTLH